MPKAIKKHTSTPTHRNNRIIATPMFFNIALLLLILNGIAACCIVLYKSVRAKKLQRRLQAYRNTAEAELLHYMEKTTAFQVFYKGLHDSFEELLTQHLPTLSTRKRQLITMDHYGLPRTEAWEKELQYFVSRVLTKAGLLEDLRYAEAEYQHLKPFALTFFEDTDSYGFWLDETGLERTTLQQRFSAQTKFPFFVDLEKMGNSPKLLEQHLIALIADAVTRFDNTPHSPSLSVETIEDGFNYELYCETLLHEAGWNARRTGGSADQGVDIIAYFKQKKYVFQCKFYSTPVGNRAVQQVLAGKEFEDADYAVVVTSSRYTRSAESLAQKLQVHLLHHEELLSWCAQQQ